MPPTTSASSICNQILQGYQYTGSVRSASVRVRSSSVNVAGVKLTRFEHFTDTTTPDSKADLTGLARGGQQVQELELLTSATPTPPPASVRDDSGIPVANTKLDDIFDPAHQHQLLQLFFPPSLLHPCQIQQPKHSLRPLHHPEPSDLISAAILRRHHINDFDRLPAQRSPASIGSPRSDPLLRSAPRAAIHITGSDCSDFRLRLRSMPAAPSPASTNAAERASLHSPIHSCSGAVNRRALRFSTPSRLIEI